MNKKAILLVIILVIAFVGIISFNHKRPVTIETLNAFISSDSISIQSENSGKIKVLPVKQAEKVQKGQVIAEIETSVKISKPVTTSNNSTSAQKTQQEYENAAIMYKDGIISQEEYDKYVKKLNKAQEEASQPKTRQEIVTTSKVTKVYSPIDGIVVLNNLKEGDTIKKEAILAKVNSSHKEVNAYFSPSNKENIKEGSAVDITVIKYPEKTFRGKIVDIAEIDKKGIPVKVTFDQDTSSLDFQNGDSVIVKIKQ